MSLPAIDTFLFFFINKDLQNSLFDILMPLLTKRAYLVFLPLCLWVFIKDRKVALTALLLGFASLLISDWAANTLKYFFERIRPCNELEGVRLLVGCRESFSMPSNHAVNAFAFTMPVYFLLKSRMRYAFLSVAVLVGLSRVYVGVHYPSDVIAGAFLGTGISITVLKAYGWASGRYPAKPYSTVLIVFLLSISLFRIFYILNGPLDLSPDEAHYWEWSRRLDLSYYSKGPMIAYLISLGTYIFGDTVFGVRIMAVLFSFLSSILLYILGRRMYDERVGLFSAIFIQIIPLFSAYGILFTIDSPFIFFWILSLFLFREAVNNQKSNIRGQDSSLLLNSDNPPLSQKGGTDTARHGGGRDFSMVYWRLLGLSIGLGLLTKYTMVFFYPCALLFFLLSKGRRGILPTKGPSIAFIISILVFSPVLIWNANHDWVTLRHTAGQAHIAEGIRVSLQSFLEFSGSQLGVITPLLFILMAVSVWKLRKKPEGDFLFWFSIPVFAFFLLKSMQAKVQANWALPGYIAGIIAFSAFYTQDFSRKTKWGKVLIVSAVLLTVLITSIAHYPSMVNLPARVDPALRITGWKELGAEVTGLYEQMSADHRVFIFSDRYQVASELAFYVEGNPVTYCVNLNRRMNQYDLWPGFHNLLHYHAIFVRTGDVALPERIANAFHKVEKKVFTAYTKKREKIRDYSIFLCYDFKGLKEERPAGY